jgi:hypothetical protein
MDIKSKEQAIMILRNIDSALDRMTVQGKQNCLTVVAVVQDINRLISFLTQEGNDTAEK